MEKVVRMTVPPPLLAKNQSRELSQVSRQTVSIRTVPSSLSFPREEAGATVFVTGNTSAVDSTATCRSKITDVKSVNVHDWQKTVECPKQQEQHQTGHVVKIKISPSCENSRVISSVRLNLDDNSSIISRTTETTGNKIQNGHEYLEKHNGVGVSSATKDLAKNCVASAGCEDCVRISVVNSKDNINNDSIVIRDLSQDQNRDDMVQRGAQEGLNASCFYYGSFQSPLTNMVMSSGQCSSSDTLDSGTCSDLDGTPPPLPKKNLSPILLGENSHHSHNRTGSSTSSGAEVYSDDNESNISCDSLNSEELSVTRVNGSSQNLVEKGTEFHVLASSVDIKKDPKDVEVARRREAGQAPTKLEIVLVNENDPDLGNNGYLDRLSNSLLTQVSPYISPPPSLSPSGISSLSKASSTPRVQSPELVENRRLSASPIVKECTYEERKQEQQKLEAKYAAANSYANYNRSSATKYVYDDDRFYKFYLNEHCCNNELSSEYKLNGNENGAGDDKENNEHFAGYKILEKEAIRSAKGTVRGVKNRVRAGIATFLQKPSTKNYKTRDAGKVVVYTTTMGVVRETYYACMKVKQILRTHLVKYEERDMFMSIESQNELRDRIGSTSICVPQLFIDGQYIGDADTVERLNECGELRLMLKPYKSADACTTCKICGGYRLLPCPVCNGSKKSVHRNDFTTEFVALKCMNCDEVGLVRCQHC